MSIKDALAFIQAASREEAVKQRIEELSISSELPDLVRFGGEMGYEFSAEEFNSAFKRDWAMRWQYFSSAK